MRGGSGSPVSELGAGGRVGCTQAGEYVILRRMKVTVTAWKCEACGHVWIAGETIPPQCVSSKCRSRKWNVSGIDESVPTERPVNSLSVEAKIERQQRKAEKRARLHEDCREALPDAALPAMRAALSRPATAAHAPGCRCLRCAAVPPTRPALPPPTAAVTTPEGVTLCPHGRDRRVQRCLACVMDNL